MAKRNQILRVPQKKYTEETVEAVPVLGLPHENLIPPGHDAAQSDGAHTRPHAGDAADETGAAASAPEAGDLAAPSTGDRGASGAPYEGRSRPAHSAGGSGDAGDTGHTGYTSITERSIPPAADAMQHSAGTALKGRTRDVWNYFC